MSLAHRVSARRRLLPSVVVLRPRAAVSKVLPALLRLPLQTLALLLLRAPWLASSPLALLLLFCKQRESMMGYDDQVKECFCFS